MSKTTALTFTAAIVLFLACMAVSQYGDRVTENQMSTPDGQFAMYDSDDIGLKTHERLAGLIGLLSFSVAGAGALLWNREIYPRAQRASVLGLEVRTGRRIIRMAVPRKIVAAAKIHVEDSRARLHEDESLTPLERVIRGY
jgi:hypothetical protein